ncbi:YIP1 family protein, partial [Microvirga sp. 3-52]|nr:YIP1 family protein [Microvirga sp. 3-52]
IWSQPKNTVQYMIDNKRISYLVFLAILASLATGILAFADSGLFEGFSLPVILVIVTILSIIISIASWGFGSLVYTWIGKWLGGTGTIKNMSYAVAAGLIPTIWTMPIGFIAVILYGKSLFSQPVGDFAITNMSTGFYLIQNLLIFGVSIYGLVVLSKGIGLVHNFSAWRGFGAVMIFLGISILIAIVVLLPLLFILFL